MKRMQLFHSLLAALAMIVSITGCARVSPSVAEDVVVSAARQSDEIRNAVRLAGQYADEAERLAANAQRVKNVEEMLLLNRQAETAAENASKAAREAADLQAMIDDIAVKNQLAREVQQAQASAKAAQEYRAAINRFLQVIQEENIKTLQSSVDNVTDTIWQRVNYTGDASDEQAKQWLKEIIAGSYCDLLVDSVANNQAPTEADVQKALGENALKVGRDITGISDIVSPEVLTGFKQLISGKPADRLEQLKEVCGEALMKF